MIDASVVEVSRRLCARLWTMDCSVLMDILGSAGISSPTKTLIIGHPGQNQHGIRKFDFRMPPFSVPWCD
jgi:hypothetical protein